MSKVLLLGFAVLFFATVYTCNQKHHSQVAAEGEASDTVSIVRDSLTVSFEQDIVPILRTRCSPCHFPGGKMYAKMPFDEPQTIKDHPEGVLRRISESDENSKIKAFLGV